MKYVFGCFLFFFFITTPVLALEYENGVPQGGGASIGSYEDVVSLWDDCGSLFMKGDGTCAASSVSLTYTDIVDLWTTCSSGALLADGTCVVLGSAAEVETSAFDAAGAASAVAALYDTSAELQAIIGAGVYQAPLVAGTDYLAPNGDGSGLSGVIKSVLGDTSGAVPVLFQDFTAFTGSDATPDVSTSSHFKNVDTTTITGFDGTPVDGQHLWVRCDYAGVFDITSSSIVAPNRTTDYTCVVGEVHEFVYNSATSKWVGVTLPNESATLTFSAIGLVGSDASQNAGDYYLSTDFYTLTGDTYTPKDAAITAAKVAAVMKQDGMSVPIGNGTDAISTGIVETSYFRVPFKCTLTDVILTTVEVVGALTADVWCDAPGATNGLAAITDADSLFDTATEPAIADASADNYIPIASFDSGEDALAEGDICVVNVDSATTITRAQVFLQFDRVD